jgi:hypothetical protein
MWRPANISLKVLNPDFSAQELVLVLGKKFGVFGEYFLAELLVKMYVFISESYSD